jgi:hypothetical protein
MNEIATTFRGFMKVGIDLDNTIVDYDAIFQRLANELGNFSGYTLSGKESISNYLRSNNREREWTQMQGLVYGQQMYEAKIADGFKEAILSCASLINEIVIISHRTYHPAAGGNFDLHKAAQDWIEKNIRLDPELSEIKLSVIFETTLENKIKSISDQDVSIFIDDHIGVLSDKFFPISVKRIHYSKVRVAPDPIISMSHWDRFSEIIKLCKL